MSNATGKTLLTLLVATGACGGGGDGPTQPPGQTAVLTSLTIAPSQPVLFTVAPENTVTLVVTPRDQNSQPMSGLGAPSFSSDDPGVATVSSAGLVTATGPGGTQIRASLTAGGVTRTASTLVTVQVAPAAATVTAPQTTFSPNPVHVAAGGTVTWSFATVPHDVTFTAAGSPANIPVFSNASDSRTFPNSGSFSYVCTIHSGMTASVTVH